MNYMDPTGIRKMDGLGSHEIDDESRVYFGVSLEL